MPKARLVIAAVVIEGRNQTEVAEAYGLSPGRISKSGSHREYQEQQESMSWLIIPH